MKNKSLKMDIKTFADFFTVINRIEKIVSDDFCHDTDFELATKKIKNIKEKIMAQKLMQIYRMVHSINPTHSCYFVHKEWRDEALK